MEDARLWYPDLSVLQCSSSQVLSLTGECLDGSEGRVVCGRRYGKPLEFFHEARSATCNILFNGC